MRAVTIGSRKSGSWRSGSARWWGIAFLACLGLGAAVVSRGLCREIVPGSSRQNGTEPEGTPNGQATEVLDVQAAWPTFRGGPQLQGSRVGKIQVPPKLLWTHNAGDGIESTPAIVDGRVFVGTFAHLLALDLDPRTPERRPIKDGHRIWSVPIEAGTRSSPAVAKGLVFFGDDYGVFHALHADTGKTAWTYPTEDEAEIISSPNFFGETVLFGSYDGHVYCLNAKDGKEKWRYQTEGQVHATLAVAGDYTFVAGCDEFLRVIHLPTGKETWALPVGGNCAASPAMWRDRLYLGTLSSEVLAIDWQEQLRVNAKAAGGEAGRAGEAGTTAEASRGGAGKETAAPASQAPDGKFEAAGADAKGIAWRYEHPRKKFPFFASPAVGLYQKTDGNSTRSALIVVAAGRDKMVHAIDGETGTGLWTFPTKGRVDASPVIIGDHVFAASLDGTLYLIELKSGDEAWRFTAGEALRASPAVGEGRLVLASEDGLVYCFDLVDSGGNAPQQQ